MVLLSFIWHPFPTKCLIIYNFIIYHFRVYVILLYEFHVQITYNHC